jgi:prepilin-type processing-associated H-X9-DG protein
MDYVSVEKTVGGFRGAASGQGYFQVNNRNEGALGEFTVSVFAGNYPMITDRIMTTTVRDVRDGLSNTLLISEWAGRNKLYAAGGKEVPIATAAMTDAAYVQSKVGGGLWADYFNAPRINGTTYDGLPNAAGAIVGGPCGVNCSNSRAFGAGLYSFHPGGVHVLLCDGAVRFISNSISNVTLVCLHSRDEGDGPLGEF